MKYINIILILVLVIQVKAQQIEQYPISPIASTEFNVINNYGNDNSALDIFLHYVIDIKIPFLSTLAQ